MTRALSALAVAAALVAAGCTADPKPATPAPAPSPVPAGGPAALVPVKVEPSKGYPLTTCVVSGDELGSMGDPIAYKVGDVEVQLCCKGCVSKLTAEPQKYVDLVKAAAKK
jgi:hypothetical protein